MQKVWVLKAFDCQGNPFKSEFDREQDAYDFAENHGLQILYVKPEWYGVSI